RRRHATADLLSLDDEDPRTMEQITLRHPLEGSKQRTLSQDDLTDIEPLLVDVLDEGRLVDDPPSIEAMRARRTADLARLDLGVKRLINPHIYHVSLTQRLWELKEALIESAKHGGH